MGLAVIALAAGALTVLLAAEGPRVALLVGNDAGFPEELLLRHTASDAERLAAVLRDLGGFAPAEVRVLQNRTAAEILDAVDLLARGPPASAFVFYYSGHADAAALHPAGTLLPVDLLLHRLHAVPAELRLAVLDACQSGAAARAKGSDPAPPFAVRLDEQGSEGDILISSSAADEQSFEGEHGGLFSLHWTAGLRGAADANGDAQVTLGEAYEYAYAQTLRSTLAATSGPQHARFRYQLAGRRDPVLTRLAGGALLTLQPRSEGEYVIFDGRERSVVAELPARPGEARRLALAPGGYVVRQRTVGSLRLARIDLARGDDRVLPEHQMQEVPLLRLARKGEPGERRVAVAGGQYFSGLGPRGPLVAMVGVEWDGARWLSGVDLAISYGDERHRGLTTRDALVQASGSLLHTVRAGAAALRLGPAAGVAWLRQDAAGRGALDGVGVSLGLRLRGDVPISPAVALHALADGRALAARTAGPLPRPSVRAGAVGIVPWGSYGIGISAAF